MTHRRGFRSAVPVPCAPGNHGDLSRAQHATLTLGGHDALAFDEVQHLVGLMDVRNGASPSIEENPDHLRRPDIVRAAKVVQPHGAREVFRPVRRPGFLAVRFERLHRNPLLP